MSTGEGRMHTDTLWELRDRADVLSQQLENAGEGVTATDDLGIVFVQLAADGSLAGIGIHPDSPLPLDAPTLQQAIIDTATAAAGFRMEDWAEATSSSISGAPHHPRPAHHPQPIDVSLDFPEQAADAIELLTRMACAATDSLRHDAPTASATGRGERLGIRLSLDAAGMLAAIDIDPGWASTALPSAFNAALADALGEAHEDRRQRTAEPGPLARLAALAGNHPALLAHVGLAPEAHR